MKMLQSAKRFWWIILLVAGVPAARGFSLLDPVIGGNTWQVATIDYMDNTRQFSDFGGPGAIGEGYRRNTPVMYYTYDANFLTFFGTGGAAEGDKAFAMWNAAFTNNPTGITSGLDGYSSDLSEFPFYSQSINYWAQTLRLTDLKSVIFGTLVEQMGLADPVRYVWTLRSRTAGANCPLTTTYLVIQRNIDTVSLPAEQAQYSSYINNVLYTYSIFENCAGANPLAGTTPIPADPTALIYAPVASMPSTFLDDGYFYTGFTRDDVAGLRYLYSSNNIATEDAALGAQLWVTNTQPNQVLTTLPLGLLLQAQTNSPAALQALYPTLTITSVATNLVTNVISAFTAYYTNAPGSDVTNYDVEQLLNPFTAPTTPILSGTIDFGLFTRQLLTNTTGQVVNTATAIAQLQTLYPGLVVVSASYYWTNVITTNFVTTQVIPNGEPYPGTNITVTSISGVYTNYEVLYNYVFGNLMLRSNNTFYPFVDYNTSRSLYNTNETVVVQTTSIGTQIGAPYGSPPMTNITSQVQHTYGVTGDFFIMPTNWCGFKIVQSSLPNVLVSYTNLVAAGYTNGAAFYSTNITVIYSYTNMQFLIQPGICEPVLQFVTNSTSTFVTNYQYTFGNVQILPNSYFTNSSVTVITTNVQVVPGGNALTLVTNTTQTNIMTGIPTGEFFILPTGTCTITILTNQPSLTVVTYVTNLFTVTGTSNLLFSQETISAYTNHSYVVQVQTCGPVTPTAQLRRGIGQIKFVRADYDSLLSQTFKPVTNNYTMVMITNSQQFTEFYRRVVTVPDILLTAADTATTGGLALNRTAPVWDEANILTGLAGPGTINPPITLTFDKIGLLYNNAWAGLNTNAFLGEANQTRLFVWGTFDYTTNAPVVYGGASLTNLIYQVVLQISPAALPNGANGSAYAPVQFTTTGGGAFQPPFTWSATGLPSGLTFTPGGLLSGTPTVSGTFDITILLTDSLGRSVNWIYPILIN
jgi:hypothetical protein